MLFAIVADTSCGGSDFCGGSNLRGGCSVCRCGWWGGSRCDACLFMDFTTLNESRPATKEEGAVAIAFQRCQGHFEFTRFGEGKCDGLFSLLAREAHWIVDMIHHTSVWAASEFNTIK